MSPFAADPPITPGEAGAAWTFDPVVVASLVVVAWAYGYGVHRLWIGGRGRGVGSGRVMAFSCGLLALGTALLSPVGALGHTLFAAHMIQHLMLMLVAAPL
nr:cytochrome c oxidase assembly protein [Actinomycetota bacterium]